MDDPGVISVYRCCCIPSYLWLAWGDWKMTTSDSHRISQIRRRLAKVQGNLYKLIAWCGEVNLELAKMQEKMEEK